MADEKAKKRPAGERAAKAAPRYHPERPIDSEEALARAAERLLALDPALIGKLVAIGGPPPLRRREPGFAGLAAIIVSQQVSVASARAIFGRLETRIAPLEPAGVLAAADETLRSCGLSTPKLVAIRSLAAAVANEGLDLAGLAALDAVDAHARLVAVKGVGPWTADIFLLFCLGHPDAFPSGDLALQEATRLALDLKTRPDPKKLEQIAERWRPWRAVAARMLWAFYAAAKRRDGAPLAESSPRTARRAPETPPQSQ